MIKIVVEKIRIIAYFFDHNSGKNDTIILIRMIKMASLWSKMALKYGHDYDKNGSHFSQYLDQNELKMIPI